ncbi:putative proteasome endopeptidase complex [Helianthus anomalus]
MTTEAVDVLKTGFSFDLCRRNKMMTKKGLKYMGILTPELLLLASSLRYGMFL